MQFQSDILGIEVHRPDVIEITALGAAYFAGLAIGYFRSKEEIAMNWKIDKSFKSKIDIEYREILLKGWHKAVKRSMRWSEE